MIQHQPPPTPEEVAEFEAKSAEYRALLHNSRLDRLLEWGAALIFAAVVLAGWFLFNSVLLGFLMAAPITALMVWGMIAINRRRLRSSHEWLKANAHRFQTEEE